MKKLEDVKDLLVVVDMINGFINEGKMSDPYIKHIVPGIENLVKKYVDNEEKEVFYIRDSHPVNAAEFKKFPVHCVEGTSESEMVEQLAKYNGKVRTYKKNSTSAIFAKGLLEDIEKMNNLKRVVVVGCCSDICVINFTIPLINYFDEHNKKIEVEVREDLIETYNIDGLHNRNEYNEMARKFLALSGAKLTKEKTNCRVHR